jgi:N-hydroxyarylamine O-acetyltransferase
MNLSAYLARIHYDGSLEPTLENLKALHRHHLLYIPYENLDIHLGHKLTLDEGDIFDKLVNRKRGGWCFEMNGLFAWVLRQLGYQVTMLASTVNRSRQGDRAEGNHLILRVDLDKPYLVDVGFGTSFLEPLPLEEGLYHQEFYTYRLRREGDRWFFQHHLHSIPEYDFTLQPRLLSDFAAKCHELQTSPESGFVQVTVCQRFTPDGLAILRGATLRTVKRGGEISQTIDTEALYRKVLQDHFGLRIGDNFTQLWHNVWQRHLAWIEQQGTL